MAINPNDNFIAGQILTATECNQFPRGIMALSTLTTNTTVNTTETTRTSVTWTAVASRYYKITWFEGNVSYPGSSTNNMYLRQTTTAGTIIGNSVAVVLDPVSNERVCSIVTTFAAGSQTVFARVLGSVVNNTTYAASATQPAFLMVEDIGPA